MAQSFGTREAVPRASSAQVLDYAIPTVILLAVLVVLAPVPPALVDLMLAAKLEAGEAAAAECFPQGFFLWRRTTITLPLDDN